MSKKSLVWSKKMQKLPLLTLIRRVMLLSFVIGSTILHRFTPHLKDNNVDCMGLGAGLASACSQQNLDARGDTDQLRRLGDPPQQLRQRSRKNNTAQFGLAVAHCNEDMEWIDEVDHITIPDESGRPRETTWDATVYERCGQSSSEKYSQWQMNIGSEECSAYLRYIIDRYDDGLPEVVYFLQPDALTLHTVRNESHTSFSSLQDLVAASHRGVASNTNGFLSLGHELPEVTLFATPKGPYSNPAEIIDMMKERAPSYMDTSMLRFVPGACLAVRRERILAHPSEYYKDLLLALSAGEFRTRWTCSSLEMTWHIVFGEGLTISPTAILSYHQREGIFAV